MARSEEKKRISESIEEVDQLLDDMAIVSQQMREGKRLHSDEELEVAIVSMKAVLVPPDAPYIEGICDLDANLIEPHVIEER